MTDTLESDFEQWAKSVLDAVEREDEASEYARVRKETMALNYYRGLQRGFWDNGEFHPLDPTLERNTRAQAVLLSDNIFRPQVRALIKEWSRSRTSLKVRSRNGSRRTAAAARWATGAIELLQTKIQNESFRQQEGKYSTVCGNYFRWTQWARDERSPKIRVPIFAEVVISAESYVCPECGDGSDTGGTCEQCGVERKPRPAQVAQAVKGYSLVSIGEPTTVLVDPRAVKLPLSTRQMTEHSYLRLKLVDEIGRVRRRYRDSTIAGGVQDATLLSILETERNNGSSESAFFNAAGSGDQTRCEVIYLWLKPDRYFDVKFDSNIKFDELEIKRNVPLDEQFPEGICLEFASGKLKKAYAQNLASVWCHGTYDELAETPYGDGLDDAIHDQSRINELMSMQMENALFNSFSKTVVNTKLVDPSLLHNNSDIVPMNPNVSTDIKPEQSFAIIPPNELSGSITQLRQQIEENMRAKTSAYLSMTGTNDPALDTATSMSIARDAAVATLGLALALRSEVDVENSYQWLELLQQNWVPEYHEKMLGDYSIEEAQAFVSCDVRNDLEITIEANSWIPRTEDQVRADFVNFLTAGGLPMGFANPQLPIEIREAASEVFRAPVQLNQIQPDIRIAEARIDRILEAAEHFPRPEEVGEVSDQEKQELEAAYESLALMLVGETPVRTYTDDHQTIIQTYIKFLKTDEGLRCHPAVEMAIELLIQRHRDAMRKLSQEAQGEAVEDQARASAIQQALQSQQAPVQENPSPDEKSVQQVSTQTGRPTAVSPALPDSKLDHPQVAVPA